MIEAPASNSTLTADLTINSWGMRAVQAMPGGVSSNFRMAEGPDGAGPDYVSSDCPIAGRHIMQGIRDSGRESGGDENKAQKAHPLSLLRKAYGI